jgi:hypothetical protein
MTLTSTPNQVLQARALLRGLDGVWGPGGGAVDLKAYVENSAFDAAAYPARGAPPLSKVRKAPSWPRSWANFSLL